MWDIEHTTRRDGLLLEITFDTYTARVPIISTNRQIRERLYFEL